jgi:SAM-dependent methyltransferase
MTIEDYYSNRGRLAIYLEIEWSDYLFQEVSEISAPPNPSSQVVPPYFYQRLSDLVADWSNEFCVKRPASFLEVGGGTGRFTFELAKKVNSLESLCFVEPSKNFFSWAERLLKTSNTLPPFPVIDSENDRMAAGRPPVIEKLRDDLKMLNDTLESSIPYLDMEYDMVVSCNVVDRHENPFTFANKLQELTCPGGLLVICSPLDFRDDLTPEENRIADLKDLFDSNLWDNVAEIELPYSWRKWTRPRSWVGFSCQVVAFVRKV